MEPIVILFCCMSMAGILVIVNKILFLPLAPHPLSPLPISNVHYFCLPAKQQWLLSSILVIPAIHMLIICLLFLLCSLQSSSLSFLNFLLSLFFSIFFSLFPHPSPFSWFPHHKLMWLICIGTPASPSSHTTSCLYSLPSVCFPIHSPQSP